MSERIQLSQAEYGYLCKASFLPDRLRQLFFLTEREENAYKLNITEDQADENKRSLWRTTAKIRSPQVLRNHHSIFIEEKKRFVPVLSSLVRKYCVIGLCAAEFLGASFVLYVPKNKRLQP